jgi:hypothetical protein
MVDRGAEKDIQNALPADRIGEMRRAASWNQGDGDSRSACECEAQVAAAAVPPVQRSTPREQGDHCKKLGTYRRWM